MADETLTESLADAVANGVSIDWQSQGARWDAADPDLVRTFRVIASVGQAQRAIVLADHQRGARAQFFLCAAVAGAALAKLALAALSAIAGWSRVAPQLLQWPYALNLTLFATSGLLLVIGGTRDRRVQTLGVFYLIIGSAFADPLLPAQPEWTRHLFFDAFLAMALWQFVWLFPTEPRQPLARRIGRAFLVTTSVLGLGLCAANIMRGLSISSTFPTAVGLTLRVVDRTDSTLLYWPMLFTLTALAIPFLLWKSRAETTADRRRIRWFVTSLALGLSPMLFVVILTPLIPEMGTPVWKSRIGVVLYVALASIVPSTAYAVIVRHVMDVHLVIRRTIQYFLARSFVWGAIVGPLLFVAVDMYKHRHLTLGEYLSAQWPFAPLALSSFSLVVLTFRQQILGCVDRWFLRGAADYTEALARLERTFRTTRTIRDISRTLTRELDRAVHPSSVGVLIADEKSCQLVSLEGSAPALGRGSALFDVLRSVRTETQLSCRADGAVAGLLPPADRQWLAKTGFRLFSPLVSSTGTLLGVVGLGEGKNGLPYTKQDNMLITAMSGQAALKLENNWLHEQSAMAAGTRTPVDDTLSVSWESEPAVRCPECALMWTPTTRHCSCGTATVEAALPLVVKGKFRVDRFIGAGGTGVVYHAVDLTLDRQVAIKTLPAIRLEHASRLHREARAMATVLHPNLALIYGAEHWNGTPLLIFEYLDGGTLLDSLRRGPIPLDEVIDLGTLLADALDRVHTSGVLHRDIKPSNIGYTSAGVPKLLDFGLAAILDRSRDDGTPPAVLPTDAGVIAELAWGAPPTTSLAITQQLVGTPLYLSPEALAGAEPQPSFDLWSLSLVLYEAFAGRHPLAGKTTLDVIKRIQEGVIPDIRDFRPDCPSAFAAFLNDALSPVFTRRPATASDLRTHLQWLQRTLSPQASESRRSVPIRAE